MSPTTLFQMSVMHEVRLANQNALRLSPLRHHRVTGLQDIGAGAPWSASSNTFNLPLVSRIVSGVQPIPTLCVGLHDAMAATNPPAWKPCVAARIGWLQRAMSPPPIYRLCITCAASQDLHDGGLSCHVPPVAGPTARRASSLSAVALQSIRPVTLNCHCAITASPPGSAEHPTSLPCAHPAPWTRMPSIRSRSHGVCS